MPDARPIIVISGAPELKSVPQHFWVKLAAFMRAKKTGGVTFNVHHGAALSLDAREHVASTHVRAEDEG